MVNCSEKKKKKREGAGLGKNYVERKNVLYYNNLLIAISETCFMSKQKCLYNKPSLHPIQRTFEYTTDNKLQD